MRFAAAVLGTAVPLALLAANSRAATAYVTDELVLGVYADAKTLGPRLATLHSGAAVETLSTAGDSTQVRLADGMVGWVKSNYLINTMPATVRLKELQEELDRSHATTPELAEAAARSEVARLTHELELREAAVQSQPVPAVNAAVAPTTAATLATSLPSWALWVATLLLSSAVGFWLGYAALARRIKNKFGGIKVY